MEFFQLRQTMSTEEIRAIRVRIIMRENKKFLVIVQNDIEFAATVSRRWLAAQQPLQAA